MAKDIVPSTRGISRLNHRKFLAGLCLAVGLVAGQAQAQTAPPADWAALEKAAKAEGQLTFYGSATDNVLARVVKAFDEKYGIKAQFLRLAGSQLLQRFASEAEAGNVVADVVVSSSDLLDYAENTGIPKGLIEPLAAAKLPAMEGFPKQFLRRGSPLVQIQLWMFVYNTEKVKAADAPKDWPDIVDPRYKEAFLLPDPASAVPYLELWDVLHQKYGDGFFEKLRALNPRRYTSGVPAAQSLAAGEGSVQAPVTGPQIKALTDKGAPLATVKPSFTTGVEFHIMLTARGKSKSPNAARLFANWLITPEGNKVLNADPGVVSVYDTASMPAEYVSPDPKAASKKDQLSKLLGF